MRWNTKFQLFLEIMCESDTETDATSWAAVFPSHCRFTGSLDTLGFADWEGRIRLCLHLNSVTCSSSSSVFCFLVPFFCLLDVFVVCLNKHQIYRHPQLTTCNRCTFSSSLTITRRAAVLGKSFFKKETFYLWRLFIKFTSSVGTNGRRQRRDVWDKLTVLVSDFFTEFVHKKKNTQLQPCCLNPDHSEWTF